MDRLHLERLQPVAKPIHESVGWKDHTGTFAAAKNVAHSAHRVARAEVAALVAIRRAIITGTELPPGCYRRGIGATPDPLLTNHGIMHLHLGQPDTRSLLYIIQYTDRVAFLEINDHKYVQMATLPSSQNLLAVHQAWLKRFETQGPEA